MKTTTVGATVGATCNALRSVFARYGLPAQIVSDNGPPFQSVEYSEFLQQNGIQRILVSSYHPSSNGLAERFVQTFKYALESSVADPAYTPQQQITRFLLSYRSTPHATTGSSPARLFLGRDLSTCLSLTRPDLASCVACQQGKMKSNHDKHTKFQDVAVGDTVLARDHLSSRKWQSGTVVQQTAPHSYSVQQQDGQTWRRHLDDILLNSSSSGTTKAEEAPTEGDLQDYPGEANSSTPEDCGPEDPPPTATPASPELRRSKRTPKPPQRLIEEL